MTLLASVHTPDLAFQTLVAPARVKESAFSMECEVSPFTEDEQASESAV